MTKCTKCKTTCSCYELDIKLINKLISNVEKTINNLITNADTNTNSTNNELYPIIEIFYVLIDMGLQTVINYTTLSKEELINLIEDIYEENISANKKSNEKNKQIFIDKSKLN